MSRVLWRQLKIIDKKERRMLKARNPLIKSKVQPLVDDIEEKIPERLKETLELAFYRGFKLVFEKGHTYIEKTYNKDRIQLEYDLNDYALDKRMDKKHIKELDKRARKATRLNSIISGVEGGVLGALGIGLPDIPLFISLILKNIYQIALSYGYSYDKEEEKAYILLLISATLADGDMKVKLNAKLDVLGQDIDKGNNIDVDLDKKINTTSKLLTNSLLAAKFIQGIPILGAMGAMVNFNILRKVGKYSSLKYKKRFLLKKARNIIRDISL